MTSFRAVVLSVFLSFIAVGMLDLCFGLGLFDEESVPIRSQEADFATVWFACIFGIGKLLYIAYDQYDDARYLSRVAGTIYKLYGYGMGFYCWDEVLGLARGEDLTNKQTFFAWYAIIAAATVTLGVLWSFVKKMRANGPEVDEPSQ